MHGGKLSVVCTLGTVAGAGILYAAYKLFKSRKEQPTVPTKWRAIGKLKSLYMYPLRSGHRYELEEAYCSTFGLQKEIGGYNWKDRSFVLYDPFTMESKTAKQYPALVRVTINPESPGRFSLSTPDMEKIEIDLSELHHEINQTKLKDIWDCGDAAAQFISTAILKPSSNLRLGYRIQRCGPNVEFLKNGCSDVSPFHLVSKSSVDKLNKELAQPVTEHYFRPNFYICGHHLQAWEEESWEWIKIGNAVFRNLKTCVRCVITTVDPQTGIKHGDGEPLKTLQKLDLLKDSKINHTGVDNPVVGIHLTLLKEGDVHVNDQVYIA